MKRPRLAFVSPVFLFPNDAGGKIRSTNILRGLKGGAFELCLLSPATAEQQQRWAAELQGVCDEFRAWRPSPQRPRWARAIDLVNELPINVVADKTAAGTQAVRQALAGNDIDLVVFDFVHSAVLAPVPGQVPSVCFTHNVEAEIFERHAAVATDPARRWLWRSQFHKMRGFEAQALRRFDKVIAVSERDARFFGQHYGVRGAEAIPTGVDLEFFGWQAPPSSTTDHTPTVVFTGSMDWAANIDGVKWFLERVWPRVLQRVPQARFDVVGRNPPEALRSAADAQVRFTGFVDDVRPYVHAAHAFVIPLLVGGGTRIKAFEAMAMGCPVVSTRIGIEGLGVTAGVHHLEFDEPQAMADAAVELLQQPARREALSRAARAFVETSFGHRRVASAFETICLGALRAPADRRAA